MIRTNFKRLTVCIILSVLLISMLNSCGIFKSLVNKDDTESETESDTVAADTEPVIAETTTEPPIIVPPTIVTQPPEIAPPVGGNAFAASGTINSESNQLLKLHIDWVAYQTADEEYANVELSIFLECYAITVGARTNSTLTVNGEKKEFPTDRITNENNSLTVIELYSETIQVHNPAGNDAKSVEVEAGFYFGGSYGGESIGWIEAKGVVNFVDDGSPVPEPKPETEAEVVETTTAVEEEQVIDENISDEIPPEETTVEVVIIPDEEVPFENADGELEPSLPEDPFAPIEEE